MTKPRGSITIVDYGLPKSLMAGALVYRVIKLYEHDYYAEFVKSDWRALLESAGVEVSEERPALRRMARIMTGRKAVPAARIRPDAERLR